MRSSSKMRFGSMLVSLVTSVLGGCATDDGDVPSGEGKADGPAPTIAKAYMTSSTGPGCKGEPNTATLILEGANFRSTGEWPLPTLVGLPDEGAYAFSKVWSEGFAVDRLCMNYFPHSRLPDAPRTWKGLVVEMLNPDGTRSNKAIVRDEAEIAAAPGASLTCEPGERCQSHVRGFLGVLECGADGPVCAPDPALDVDANLAPFSSDDCIGEPIVSSDVSNCTSPPAVTTGYWAGYQFQQRHRVCDGERCWYWSKPYVRTNTVQAPGIGIYLPRKTLVLQDAQIGWSCGHFECGVLGTPAMACTGYLDLRRANGSSWCTGPGPGDRPVSFTGVVNRGCTNLRGSRMQGVLEEQYAIVSRYPTQGLCR